MATQPLPLRGIHLPTHEFGWWPPAVGWWLLAGLILLLLVLGYQGYRHLTRNTAVKAASKQLQQLKQTRELDNKQKLKALSELLRRVAISVSPREQTASLTGQAWLDYLHSSLKKSTLTETVGAVLANAHYQKTAPSDDQLTQLIGFCENWLKAQQQHKK